MSEHSRSSLRQWYVSQAGKQSGPFDDKQMSELIDRGLLLADDHVWIAGWSDWQLVSHAFNLSPSPPASVPADTVGQARETISKGARTPIDETEHSPRRISMAKLSALVVGAMAIASIAAYSAMNLGATAKSPIRMEASTGSHFGGAWFSPDGERIVTIEDGSGVFGLRDTRSGDVISDCSVSDRHKDDLKFATFSPDGRWIATASEDDTAAIYDAATCARRFVLTGHGDDVLHIAFSPDSSRLVTSSMDSDAGLWDVATGKLLAILDRHSSWVFHAEFSPDGSRILTASRDKTAKVWTGEGEFIGDLTGHSESVEMARWSPDGTRILTVSGDHTARSWDARTLLEQFVLSGHQNSLNDGHFNADGSRIVTASNDQTARVWDARSGELLLTLQHNENVKTAAFAPDGSVIITGSLGAFAWNAGSGGQVAMLRCDAFAPWVRTLAFDRDGMRLAIASQCSDVWVLDPSLGALEDLGRLPR
ncbi:MAG: DUF4339 domain-containing protein [Rhizobiales bacterium]|nr:DUF4339 domain-containing protein [Hyphomicrobiales bacterium]